MYIDIYFNAESDIERDLLEERLDEILKGKGEVTGGGAGKDGVNIDIEIDDDYGNEEIIKIIKSELIRLKLPVDTYLKINGEKHNFY